MSADSTTPVADKAGPATGIDQTVETAQRALKDSLAAAERRLSEAARTAERVIKDSIETIKAQTQAYSGPASQTVDEAQRYVVERVKERPVTATLAGVGVGFLLGLLLSSRGR
ncbi:MAG: hypothetical protein JWO83_2187 [Caulobacteraceae bacterium]|jgi:ElaB/YqjD/DUF883 family membrane-anchored ribosome-binding protein|nr:hypothetical protein [Caulobacteraceae bacterium]